MCRGRGSMAALVKVVVALIIARISGWLPAAVLLGL